MKTNPALKASLRDAQFYALMTGVGENFLAPFAIYLKASSYYLGILNSLPLLIGSLCQSIGVWLSEKYKSRRAVVTFFAYLHSSIWLLIAAIPHLNYSKDLLLVALICLATANHIFLQLGVPVWSSLIGDIVPNNIRGSFFGLRNKHIGIISFISTLLAGQILHMFEKNQIVAYGFSLIFVLAFIARVTSAYWLSRHTDPTYTIKKEQRFSFWQFIKGTPKSNFARFVLFFATLNLATFVSAPYYSLYMLKDLNFSYALYTAIVSVAAISNFLFMRLWGNLSDQIGNRRIIGWGSLVISIVPFFWCLTANPWFLALLQLIGGATWAAINLCAANFLFDAVTPAKRARCTAYQAIINSAFIFIGSMLGAFLADVHAWFIPERGVFTPQSIYIKVFIASAVLRLIATCFLLPLFKEVRDVQKLSSKEFIIRITQARPLPGVAYEFFAIAFKKKKKK